MSPDLPGFAYAYMFNPRCEQIIGGIMEETHSRLLKEGHALPHTTPDFRVGYSFSLVDPDYWGLMAFEMMTENNVHLLLHSYFVDVVKDGNTVRGVVVENVSGRQAVLGKVIIDCTGEGHVSARAGAPYEQVPKDQLEPHTISFTVDGVDWEKVLQYVRDNAEYEFNAMTHPYLNWTQEQIVERIRKVKDITEIIEFHGVLLSAGQSPGGGRMACRTAASAFLSCPGTKAISRRTSSILPRSATSIRPMSAI